MQNNVHTNARYVSYKYKTLSTQIQIFKAPPFLLWYWWSQVHLSTCLSTGGSLRMLQLNSPNFSIFWVEARTWLMSLVKHFFVGIGFPYNCSWGWAMGLFSSIWHVLVSKNKPRTSQTRQINNNNKISIPMTTQQKIYPKIAENILPALGPGGPILFGITFRRLYLYLHLPIALWCDFFSK